MTVTLRPIVGDDAQLIVTWRNRPDVHQQLFAHHPPTLEGHRRWFDSYQGDRRREEFIILLHGRPVGTVGLSQIDPDNRRAEYGIILGETTARGTGTGYAASDLVLARAFGPLQLGRVFLHVFADNSPALRLYDKLGFKREGTLRRHAVKDGAARDVVVMGLLSTERATGAREVTG